jgi:hypothetical protein
MLARKRLPQFNGDRIVVEPFDGRHIGAIAQRGICDAGSDRLSIDKNRASAANALLASHVCAGQPKLFAEHVGEVRTRRDAFTNALAVDDQFQV